MSSTYYTPAILGSGQPNPGEILTIYTARPNQTVWCNTFISNLDSSVTDYVSMAIKPGAAQLLDVNYILWNTELPPNGIIMLPQFGLGPSDQIIASSQNGVAAFNISGDQIFNVP